MIKNLKSELKNYRFRTLLIIGALLLFGSFVFISTSPEIGLFKSKTEIASLPNPSSQPLESSEPKTEVMGANTSIVVPSKKPTASKTPTPTVVPSPTAQSTSSPSQNSSSNPQTGSTIPSSSAPQSSTTPQPSPSPTTQPEKKQVNLEIQAPDGTSSFQIEITEEVDVCKVLEIARDQGKIKSLTLDDQYLKAFNSKYVYEINGYKNNWTFKVNGSSPLGCSLYKVIANDSIVWKFN